MSKKEYTIQDEIDRLYSKARHDEAQALRHARLEARQEGMIEERRVIAKNFLMEGVPLETIVKATGLSRDEVEQLRDSCKNKRWNEA